MHALSESKLLKKNLIIFACSACFLSFGLLWGSNSTESKENSPEKSISRIDTTPPRGSPELELDRVGWNYDCMECHRSLKAKWERDYELSEHKHIQLDHGNNRFCLNCHHPENRDTFVDYDGSEISGDDTVALCAKCHGTLHQDWEAGAHGRKNGYWDTTKGDQTRLSCSQCHDPHSPAFSPMHPLTAPTYPERAAGKIVKETASAGHH